MALSKIYTLKEIAGRGLGLVASTKIVKGTRILAEAPLFRLPLPRSTYCFSNSRNLDTSSSKAVIELVAALSDDEKQAFFSLHNAVPGEMSPEVGIVQTNALPIGTPPYYAPDNSTAGIFVESSRINHACEQNAHNTWNRKLGQLTIHAIRDIDEGDEITITYLPTWDRRNRDHRQRTLQLDFHLICSCSLCCLLPAQRGPSDTRLDEIRRLGVDVIGTTKDISSPLQKLHELRKILQLCKEEDVADARAADAYVRALAVATCNSDLARAIVFAERSRTILAIMEGEDSPQVERLKILVREPTSHFSYGKSSQWSTWVSDVPSDASPEAFESWLWRDPPPKKETPKLQQYTNLRNNAIFPAFKALPDESNDRNLKIPTPKHGFHSRLRKHWCFLAEIVRIEPTSPLKLIVQDKAGEKVPVVFYTKGGGSELQDISLVREGYTVAILYPERHLFLDWTVGIWHDSPPKLKAGPSSKPFFPYLLAHGNPKLITPRYVPQIFPVSLNELFIMSDQVQKYANETGENERTCHACGWTAPSAKMKPCGRCSLFWYCDEVCNYLVYSPPCSHHL